MRRPLARQCVLLLAGLLPTACSSRVSITTSAPRTEAPRTLAFVIDSIADSPPLHRAHWGIAVRVAGSGHVLYERNAARHFIPASNTKLVVTLVGMGELGPDWTWQTDVAALGGSDSVPALLLVHGSGDPTLSDRFEDSDFAALDSLAVKVAGAGIRRIAGDLVIDATRFTDERVHSAWEVGDLPFSYATPTGAFAIADGTFRVIRRAGAAAGNPAHLEVIGGAELQPVVATLTTDTAGARTRWSIDFLERLDTVFITGSLAAGRGTDTVRIAVPDAEVYAGRALAVALERQGVDVEGDVRVVRDTTELRSVMHGHDSRIVARRTSPPLREVIAAILKPSQNWIAEQLLKTLGSERGEGGSWADGLDVEMRYLTGRVGLDSLAVNLRDASGLTAQNLLSPDAILAMLDHARRAPWGDAYRAALPTAGEEEGTLENRLEGFEERIRAKTGTIANVNSLSGYLRTDEGDELLFSILTNASGLPSAPVRAAMDSIVRTIARHRR